MSQYDPTGVWERVQSAPAADIQNLGNPMETLYLEARIFQQLTQKLPTPMAAIARELSRQASRHLRCLKGMHILIAGTAPASRSANSRRSDGSSSAAMLWTDPAPANGIRIPPERSRLRSCISRTCQ